jgi:hypothetical protein
MNYDAVYSKWTKEMVLSKLNLISNNLGKFPTKKELEKLKEYKLTNAICNLKLTYHDCALEIGYKPNGKPRNYWTEENILTELLKIKKFYGKIPSHKNLIDDGYSGLVKAIHDTQCMKYYKDKIGENSRNVWTETEILLQLKIVIDNLKYCPTTIELKHINSGLLGAINKSKKPYRYFQNKLGFESKTKPKGYWKKLENIKAEVEPFLENNTLPSLQKLKQEIGQHIGTVVANFGGVVEIANLLGFQISNKSYLKSIDGHYLKSSYELDFDNFLFKNNIEHSVDQIIMNTCKMRYDFKIKDTFIEIWGFEERSNNKRCNRYNKKRHRKELFYKKNNLKLISIEAKVFKKNAIERNKIYNEIIRKVLG